MPNKVSEYLILFHNERGILKIRKENYRQKLAGAFLKSSKLARLVEWIKQILSNLLYEKASSMQERIIFLICAGFISMLQCLYAQADKIYFEEYSVDEGLPSEFVSTIVQDELGYIWFTTQNGLVKYNGYSFEVFGINHQTPTEGSFQLANVVPGIIKGKNDWLWIGGVSYTGVSGLAGFNTKTQSFRNWLYKDNDSLSIPQPNAVPLFEDSHGNVWFGNGVLDSAMLCRLHIASNRIYSYDFQIDVDDFYENELVGNGFIMESSADQSIWLLPQDTAILYKWNPVQDSFEVRLKSDSDLLPTDDALIGLYPMRDGRTILTTDSGLYLWNPVEEIIESHFTHNPEDEASLLNNGISSVFEDVYGKLWISHYRSGISVIDLSLDQIQRFPYGRGTFLFPKSSRPLITTALNADSTGIWFGHYVGSYLNNTHSYFNYADQTFQYFDKAFNVKDANPVVEASTRSFLKDRTGLLWVGSRPNLYKESPKRKIYELYSDSEGGLPSNMLSCFMQDKSGRLWVGTQKGLRVFDAQSNQFKVPEFLSQFSDSYVSRIFEDSEGNFWIGTKSEGLFRWKPGQRRAQAILTYNDDRNFVSQITEDDQGRIWVSSFSLSSAFYITSFQHTDIHIFDRQTGRLREKKELNAGVFNFYEDSQNNMWAFGFGLPAGLHRYNKQTSEWKSYTHDDQDSSSVSTSNISMVREDSRGRIWIGNDGGAFSLFNPETETFSRFETKDGIQSSSVTFAEDSAGNLWVGTFAAGGLGLVDTAEQQLQMFGEASGLLYHDIDHGEFDNGSMIYYKDRLWIPSPRGLSIFDTRNQTFNNYTDIQFEPYSWPYNNQYYQTRDKSMWFATSQGLYRIYPDEVLKQNPVPPSVWISSISINGEKYIQPDSNIFQEAVPFTRSIKLPYWQGDLSFEFVALHYLNSSQNQYSWKMENLDEDWSEPSYERQIRYNNLDPKTYTFRVKASNADGVWNETGTSIKIVILPPWWQTSWAFILYFILGGLTIWGFIRWRTAAQAKKLERANALNARLQQVDQLKDQFLANTSHELRTPLQGIIGISEFLYDDAEYLTPDLIRENLALTISSGKRLSSLVNDILDFSKLQNHDIQLLLKPLNLRVLGDIVLRNNTPLIKGKDLKLINDIPSNLASARADENRLQQIIYNLVGNAIKFTEQGFVRIAAEEKGQMIEVSIEDTGLGIEKSKQELIFQAFEQGDGSTVREYSGTGLGLSISKSLVEAHGGKMWLHSEPGKGSIFYFSLLKSSEQASTLVPNSNPDLNSLNKAEKNAQKEEAAYTAALDASDAIRILVVDDELINQQVLKNHLKGQNFYLKTAMNGEEGLQALEDDSNFDLVLLDVMMPRMSGYEVCEIIRQKYLPSELPVIMITAKNQIQDIVQGLSLGANDYLAKPFQKEELLARIQTQIDLHHIFSVAGRFVPNEFIHSLNRGRITEVVLGDHIEKEVTVLFTDIRDYTSLAEAMTPEENFTFVNDFHGRLGPIIQKNNGFINQYLGDGIMAIFPSSPTDALKAAIAMRKKLAEYNSERKAGNLQAIQIGIGFHTGSLIMGIIGDRNRMDAATISDTVNTSSRLESLTKYYGASIILSEDSYEQSEKDELFHFRFLGKVQVKGKKKPIGLYECIDGDAPEQIALKIASYSAFQNAIELFFQKKFAESIVIFEEILRKNKADRPARLFLERAKDYSLNGVAEDWDGVENLGFK